MINYEAIDTWSEILGALFFVVFLVWVFRKYLVPMILAARARTNEQLAAAERKRVEMQQAAAAAEGRLEEARASVRSIEERAAADAQRERERILMDANVEGARVVNNAEGELARSRAAANLTFRDELLERSLKLAYAIARERVDERTDREIVERVVAAI
ncbi:MAG TPA: ATP synthase F0 subunit B [Candidatus Baltobacteraceae bacterium]|nr:ATP synthase F0 subunit B [Candidatus Baltobacteraceae bacterium]